MNYSELSDEEINRAVHMQVMGLCIHDQTKTRSPKDKRSYVFVCEICGDVALYCAEPPDYCTDLNAAAQAGAKAIEKVGKDRYGAALVGTLGNYVRDADIARATARQRCEAVLAALEVKT